MQDQKDCVGEDSAGIRLPAHDEAVAPFGMTGFEHRAGEIDTIRFAAAKRPAILVRAFRSALDPCAGDRREIILRRLRITIDATPPRTAVPRHFRRVDPDQAHPLAVAAERVTIDGLRLIAGEIRRDDVCLAKPNSGRPEKGDNHQRSFVGEASSFGLSAPVSPLELNDIARCQSSTAVVRLRM